MANPRSLVYALYTHWDTVELLVRLSRELAVLTSDQVLNGIAKVSGQRDAETQGAVLRALVNADILQTLPRSSDLQLNAYVLETPDQARAMAKAADEGIAKGEGGPLTGIPLGIKDLFGTEGVHTQACSHVLDGFKPRYESTVTANLWADGAVMLGKLNMDEFAMGSSNESSWYGPVRNPWDVQAVPGGSSGGSAAAVAARLLPAATGTDTGGSIRQPASLSGICGFKPTYGASSRYGLIAFASSLDTPGPFARTALDCAPFDEACAIPDAGVGRDAAGTCRTADASVD